MLNNKQLKTLNLSHNAIRDNSFTALKHCRYWETAGTDKSHIRAWLLDLKSKFNGKPSQRCKLEYFDLSHNLITDDGAVMIIRALMPLRKQQKKEQTKKTRYRAWPGGQLRMVLPRFNLANNLVSSREIRDVLAVIDSDILRCVCMCVCLCVCVCVCVPCM